MLTLGPSGAGPPALYYINVYHIILYELHYIMLYYLTLYNLILYQSWAAGVAVELVAAAAATERGTGPARTGPGSAV